MRHRKSGTAAGQISAHALRALALAAAALSLAGCYTTRDVTGTVPTDYRERHPIAIREGERTMEVFVGSHRGGLTPPQRADVIAFARNWQREATGGVIVDVPAGTPNERAAADTLKEIRAVLSASGIPGHGVSVRPYRPVDNARLATIRITYPKIMAQTGPCGLWPQDLGPSTDPAYQNNQPYWNLGCASQRNLAAMVENPQDLVQPRGETAAYTPRRSTVLDKYRKGDVFPGNYPPDFNAKLSDVGK